MAKVSISLTDENIERARTLAELGFEGNLSALVSSLIDREARRNESLRAVEEWEAEHGPISEDALRAARARWLG